MANRSVEGKAGQKQKTGQRSKKKTRKAIHRINGLAMSDFTTTLRKDRQTHKGLNRGSEAET